MKKVIAFIQKVIQPQSTGDDQVYRERMVRIILMMIVLMLVPLSLIVVVFCLAGAFSNQQLIMTLGMDLAIAICWFLVFRGRWRSAGYLTASSFFVLACAGSFLNGLNTPTVLAYAILVLLVSMFSSGKGSWVAVAASVLAHSILGGIHDHIFINTALVSAVVTAFTLTGVALLQWLATRLLRSALDEERLAKAKMSSEIDERKQLELQLQFWGMHDAMTGLYNRFFFEAELERLQYSRLYPISIIMADLDGLKHINDHFGHAFGDQLLKGVAQVLKETFRAEDVVARIGGDEFVVLLTLTDEAAIQLIAGRLRENLARYNRQCPDQIISLSIGVATGVKGSYLTQVLKLADDRMYAEKWGKKIETPVEDAASESGQEI